MPGSYPVWSNNRNNGVEWTGPKTARSSGSNNLTVRWVAPAYFSSAASQRSEPKSRSAPGFVTRGLEIAGEFAPLGRSRHKPHIAGEWLLIGRHRQHPRQHAH